MMYSASFRNICLLLACTFCLIQADASGTNYFSPDNILRFAAHLFDDGDFLRAAGEYQRYLFSSGTLPEHADSVYFKVGECYRLSSDYTRAIEQYGNTIEKFPESRLYDDCYYMMSLCYFFTGKHDESIHILHDQMSGTATEPSMLRMRQLTAANYLFQRQWQAVPTLFSTDSFYNKITSNLINYAHEGQQLPRKNSTLAGLYSAIIPGTGKFYCGRTIDGIQSLATVGVLGWQSYTGFRDNGIASLKGWIFGVIGGIFYLGNIYGSVVAAEIHNEEQEEVFLHKIRVFVNVNFN